MPGEYQALVAKVAAFTDATALRRKDDLTCSAGCSSCCHAWLTVSAVEADQLRGGLLALPADERAVVRARGQAELAREASGEREARCALLDESGRCVVYDARPLVCRTQGHALRYPAGLIPSAAIARKTVNGEETWCPLNYHAAEPHREDVLDAERVDQILAVVGARYVLAANATKQTNLLPTQRFALSQLAAEEDVRNDQTAHAAQSQATDR
jgi:Fe-S-cluster containining protein